MPNFSNVGKALIIVASIVTVPHAYAQDVSWEARRSAAMAAGLAAGELAYAPFARPLAEAWSNPQATAEIAAVAMPLTAYASSYAACMALAINPAACLLWKIPGGAK